MGANVLPWEKSKRNEKNAVDRTERFPHDQGVSRKSSPPHPSEHAYEIISNEEDIFEYIYCSFVRTRRRRHPY